MSKRMLLPTKLLATAEKEGVMNNNNNINGEDVALFWKGEESLVFFAGLPISGVIPPTTKETKVSMIDLINALRSIQKKDSALFRTPWTIGGNRPSDLYETKGRPLLHPVNFIESSVALLKTGNCLKPLENLLFGAILTCTVVKDDVWEFIIDYEGYGMNDELKIVKNKRLEDEKKLEEAVFTSGVFEYMLPYLVVESWERPAPLVFLLHFVCYSDLLHKTILKTPNLVEDLGNEKTAKSSKKKLIIL